MLEHHKFLKSLFFSSACFLLLPLQLFSQTPSDSSDYEKRAEFIGGEKALQDYIKSSVRYPKKGEKKGITEKVYVSFIVEADGSISNVKIEKGHRLYNDEAVRVVSNMPKWNPGEVGGVKIRDRILLPIIFTPE